MAKNEQKESVRPVNRESENVITIDLQKVMIPMAIVVAGLMISATTFFSIRSLDGSAVQGATTANPTAAPTAAGEPEAFPAASTTIDDDPILGNKDKAKIAIVEFSDYECPFCQRHYSQTHAQLVKNFVDTGDAIIVYRDNPLDFHPLAIPAAEAANCAREQGGDEKYYEYHSALFKAALASGTSPESIFEDLAKDTGLNISKFNSCLESGKYTAEVTADAADAAKAGSTGTPGFIIGTLDKDGNVDGKLISGAYPYADFERIINELLK